MSSNRFCVKIDEGHIIEFHYERLQWRRQWYVITMIQGRVDGNQGRVDGNHTGKHSPELYRNAEKVKLVGNRASRFHHGKPVVQLILGHAGVNRQDRKYNYKYNYIGEMAIFRVLPYTLSSEDISKIRGTHRSIYHIRAPITYCGRHC
jgi:hypothetical protein